MTPQTGIYESKSSLRGTCKSFTTWDHKITAIDPRWFDRVVKYQTSAFWCIFTFLMMINSPTCFIVFFDILLSCSMFPSCDKKSNKHAPPAKVQKTMQLLPFPLNATYRSKMEPTPALWALLLWTWRPVANRMPSFTVTERCENEAIRSSFQPACKKNRTSVTSLSFYPVLKVLLKFV